MKALYRGLTFGIWGLVGSFLGRSVFQYWDYKTHPQLYQIQSAPWYLSIQLGAVFTAIVVAVLLLIRHFVKKKL